MAGLNEQFPDQIGNRGSGTEKLHCDEGIGWVAGLTGEDMLQDWDFRNAVEAIARIERLVASQSRGDDECNPETRHYPEAGEVIGPTLHDIKGQVSPEVKQDLAQSFAQLSKRLVSQMNELAATSELISSAAQLITSNLKRLNEGMEELNQSLDRTKGAG